ncbi:peptide-binding protein [Fervidibacillus halotolerans]|uniref:Peptide-binding protein n=1 Tax=Fervidibacillus halotolerans TaxID=2980027 RepID=A0A9E8LZD7_9BACI|nr:peptide-binding protein [Fervidibacillus halotolerans]WAA12507.1 peptide-binding protein [Fervidibacillus halotolerans]
MKKRKAWLSFLAFLFIFGILTACGNNEEADSDEQSDEGESQEESILVGVMDTAPTGQFNPIFYEEAYEANILSFTHESLLTQNKKLEFEPLLAESWEFNEDHSSVTFKLRQDVYWHDGEQFTADDVVFTYKSIADPDYIKAGGVRTSYVTKLVGYEEYNSGETDEFPGVVAEDDFTVTFNFKEPNVIALADASFPIIPEHIFKDIPVIDMPSADESLLPNKVIGTGPYKFTQMIEGQEYHLTKNENYWQGEPQIEKVVWKVVNQDIILSLLEKGEIDFVADPNGFQAADYDKVDSMDHVKIIEQMDFGYQILGFIHNFRTEEDMENGVINPDNFVPNEKLADKRVRQAIAYAINRPYLIKGLLHDRGQVINSPIAKQFEYFDGENPEQYEFNPEKAKQLLDEAGYVDTNGDGFREDPNGNEWVLNMAYPKGNVIREKSAPIIEEMLEEVGININLLQPLDMSAYVEQLTNNTEWDLYLLGWSLSTTDPDPSGLWTAADAYNFGRWNNPEADALVQKAITPPNAFDSEFRKQVYSDWQVMFQDDLPALILYVKNTLYAYNTRLKGVNPSPASFLNDVHKWYLESEE